MPNRILREGILESERVDALPSWATETFYRRLMSVIDDFGRYYAKPELLRAACYPLKLDKVSNADVEKWLAECAGAALVSTYEHEGKRYVQVLNFHQQVRAKHSKFPQPPADAEHVSSKGSADAKPVRTKASAESKAITSGSKDPSVGLVLVGGVSDSTPTKPSASKGDTPSETAWDAYCQAYTMRYGVAPVRNAKVNGQLTQLVARLGAEEAPRVVVFYLTHNHRRYLDAKHSVGMLLIHCEQLRTEWKTNVPTTETEARQADRTAARGNVFDQVREELHAGGK